MNYETFNTVTKLLESLRNPDLSYGDFQKNAELIKLGLDIMGVEKKSEMGA
jgi:hypothetical protein